LMFAYRKTARNGLRDWLRRETCCRAVSSLLLLLEPPGQQFVQQQPQLR
jgi:hypothetical protein